MKYQIEKGKSIKDFLIKEDNNVEFLCNGNGICGKCLIKVTRGDLVPNDYDRQFICEEDLENGIRLSCKHETTEDIEFEWLNSLNSAYIEAKTIVKYENNFNIKEIDNRFILLEKDEEIFSNDLGYFVGIAVDIGTTTIALRVIDLVKDKVIGEKNILNSQKKYGADVISRIKFASEGGLNELKNLVVNDIEKSILSVFKKKSLSLDSLVRITISGNNVMNHIFLGVNPKKMGQIPFEPEFINPVIKDANSIFNFKSKAIVSVIGSFTSFVGGDIMSGILSLGELPEKWFLLLDLGTNGEIVLGNSKQLLVTSTAVGPALEGGNISSGIGCVEGAISNIKINGSKIEYKTINNLEPIGICGSGIIDLSAELVGNKLIIPNGKFTEKKDIEIYKNISFTQKDIRQIQYAKSAVRSGIEILVKVAKIEYEDIDNVYLSGGLGNNANIQNVIKLGMIPSVLKDRSIPSGNTSLAGAILNLFALKDTTEKMLHFQSIAKEINLGERKDFNEIYVSNFDLEEN